MVFAADWCYQSQVTCNGTCKGPEKWSVVSKLCSGRIQSPINIVTRKILPDERLTPFQFIGYQETFHGHIRNNGHTVQLDLPASAMIKSGNLVMPYKTVQLHLHWGKDGEPGSEHTIDGEQFPMEMHIVHIKEEYKSLSQALKDPNGVAVLGFFFQESSSPNKKFGPFISALKNIKHPNTNTTLSSVSLDMLIPPQSNMTKYFRYQGSLTTPGCAEAAIWTLFENAILLSRQQLAAFSQLQFSNGVPMVNTYRPVQPLNSRQVYYSGGQVTFVSPTLLISSVLASAGLSLLTKG
ncbi:carbonic anhydrase 4b [Lampris incognitus]|uniref:carbonic anhydrase 4b n=1 Tax=Lampris incognitus TaxID=2546036 RepID=UPI0024B5CC6F|nr:carbonic anhydrase 4b [Lampris incognitus]